MAGKETCEIVRKKFLTIYCYPKGCRLIIPAPPPGYVITVETVKKTVAKNRNLSPESLCLFGVFLGPQRLPLALLSDKIQDTVTEVTFQRLSFDPEKEKEICKKDFQALNTLYCDIKDHYQTNELLPLPTGDQKEQLDSHLDVAPELHSMRAFLQISQSFFYYTTGVDLDTCQRELYKPAVSLSDGIIAIKVGLNMNGITFFEASRQREIMSFPWSTIVSIRMVNGANELLIFYILVNIEGKKILRPVIVQTVRNLYLYTMAYHILNIVKTNCKRNFAPKFEGLGPYYILPFRASDVGTTIEVETFSEEISAELIGGGLSKTALAELTNVHRDYERLPPLGIFLPITENEVEKKEMYIRIVKICHYCDFKHKYLNLQIATPPEKFLTVEKVKIALARYVNLPRSENPLDVFVLYIRSNVMEVLFNDYVILNKKSSFFLMTMMGINSSCHIFPNLMCQLDAMKLNERTAKATNEAAHSSSYPSHLRRPRQSHTDISKDHSTVYTLPLESSPDPGDSRLKSSLSPCPATGITIAHSSLTCAPSPHTDNTVAHSSPGHQPKISQLPDTGDTEEKPSLTFMSYPPTDVTHAHSSPRHHPLEICQLPNTGDTEHKSLTCMPSPPTDITVAFSSPGHQPKICQLPDTGDREHKPASVTDVTPVHSSLGHHPLEICQLHTGDAEHKPSLTSVRSPSTGMTLAHSSPGHQLFESCQLPDTGDMEHKPLTCILSPPTDVTLAYSSLGYQSLESSSRDNILSWSPSPSGSEATPVHQPPESCPSSHDKILSRSPPSPSGSEATPVHQPHESCPLPQSEHAQSSLYGTNVVHNPTRYHSLISQTTPIHQDTEYLPLIHVADYPYHITAPRPSTGFIAPQSTPVYQQSLSKEGSATDSGDEAFQDFYQTCFPIPPPGLNAPSTTPVCLSLGSSTLPSAPDTETSSLDELPLTGAAPLTLLPYPLGICPPPTSPTCFPSPPHAGIAAPHTMPIPHSPGICSPSTTCSLSPPGGLAAPNTSLVHQDFVSNILFDIPENAEAISNDEPSSPLAASTSNNIPALSTHTFPMPIPHSPGSCSPLKTKTCVLIPPGGLAAPNTSPVSVLSDNPEDTEASSNDEPSFPPTYTTTIPIPCSPGIFPSPTAPTCFQSCSPPTAKIYSVLIPPAGLAAPNTSPASISSDILEDIEAISNDEPSSPPAYTTTIPIPCFPGIFPPSTVSTYFPSPPNAAHHTTPLHQTLSNGTLSDTPEDAEASSSDEIPAPLADISPIHSLVPPTTPTRIISPPTGLIAPNTSPVLQGFVRKVLSDIPEDTEASSNGESSSPPVPIQTRLLHSPGVYLPPTNPIHQTLRHDRSPQLLPDHENVAPPDPS